MPLGSGAVEEVVVRGAENLETDVFRPTCRRREGDGCFREAGDVDVDTTNIDRFRAFVDEIDDIAISARDSARWNNRDVIAPAGPADHEGLQERIREFGKLETAGAIRDWIGQTLHRPRTT